MRAFSPLILSSSRSAAGRPGVARPRTDFEVLAEFLSCRVSFPAAGSGLRAAFERRTRLDVSQAIRARRATTSVYVSLSERVGIPLALLRPDAPHIVVAHLLTSERKRQIARWTGFLKKLDAVLVFSRPQERYLREIGLAPDRARFTFDKVDAGFFAASEPVGDGYVLSVGREQRDYATLIEAIRPLPIRCIIVPGSIWSHRSPNFLSLPEHVEVLGGLSYPELRELYQGAAVVVVPVQPEIDYAAGVNSLLEAMACARPVIVSETPGLEGYVTDGIDGRLVAPGDPRALRTLISELLEDHRQSERLATSGRASVERERTVEHFVSNMTGTIHAVG